MVKEKNRQVDTVEKYKAWLDEELKKPISYQDENYYKTAVTHLLNEIHSTKFWIDVTKNLGEIHDDYKLKKEGYPLLLDKAIPSLLTKPFESMVIKSYRRNVLANPNFPNSPDEGWLLVDNWLERIHDIVRTTFVVKYIDGVEFLASKLEEIARANGVQFRVDYEAREEGYYAAHINIKDKLSLISKSFETIDIDFTYEIQVTTQLQENIKILLHKFYESNRKEFSGANRGWQWDYKSTEFSSNYLGHILHYVEGMIVDIRDKQIIKNKTEKHGSAI